MTTLTVWKFDSSTGAAEAIAKLAGVQKQHLIEIIDAAIVEWPEGKKKPKTRQVNDLSAAGALSGAFWGMLFGMLFFVPFFGMAMGAAMGALSSHFGDFGIDDDFMKSVRDQVTEGTSALFLLTSAVTLDKVEEEMKGQIGTLIKSNLTHEQEAKLREGFGEE
jgi:uncharacterized membrane protein